MSTETAHVIRLASHGGDRVAAPAVRGEGDDVRRLGAHQATPLWIGIDMSRVTWMTDGQA